MNKISEEGFNFIKTNSRPPKIRKTGITEIRGPYYSVMGKRYLEDLLETMGTYVDSLKFAGGSFVLIDPPALKEIIETAHAHNVMVSTGGFIEYILTQGKEAVIKYIEKCKSVGFDIIEISSGFITLPADDWLRLTELVQKKGIKAKPEVGIQFGAGGSSPGNELKKAGNRDTALAVDLAKRFIGAGAYMVMIESEGITENTNPWRTDVVSEFIGKIGMEKLMFEAAEPAVFDWYVRNYGYNINLFIDHSQIVQLECLRQGIWGTNSSWGRIQEFNNL